MANELGEHVRRLVHVVKEQFKPFGQSGRCQCCELLVGERMRCRGNSCILRRDFHRDEKRHLVVENRLQAFSAGGAEPGIRLLLEMVPFFQTIHAAIAGVATALESEGAPAFRTTFEKLLRSEWYEEATFTHNERPLPFKTHGGRCRTTLIYQLRSIDTALLDELIVEAESFHKSLNHIERMREAIRKHKRGAGAPPMALIKKNISKRCGLIALRELERLGEYHGFARRPTCKR